jgi:tRNA(Ile)-lysidine synthase
MQFEFEQQLESLVSFPHQKKWLLAVSGGLDSMTLLHLMLQSKVSVAVAHCDFALRAHESEQDALFVQNFCLEHQIPCFVNTFDTKQYALNHKLSTQMAARELRYNWFENLRQSEGFDFICTAHHLDDQLETFLINLSRGTGIHGLTGIPAMQNNICRPLLTLSRAQIENYAQSHKISWREDASNQSDSYLRNKIRHQITPPLKSISSDFLSTFQKTLIYLRDSQDLIYDALQRFQDEAVMQKDDQTMINIEKLLQFQNPKAYLYAFLSPFGFTAWEDIFQLIQSQSGKWVDSPSHRLLKNRATLLLTRSKIQENECFYVNNEQEVLNFPLKLRFSHVSSLGESNANTIFVDLELVTYPLLIRKWQIGDRFFPLGMNGSKKLSKYFKDEKMSLHDKEQTWVLCSNNEIVWVIGKRFDRRFQVSNTTKLILQITLNS